MFILVVGIFAFPSFLFFFSHDDQKWKFVNLLVTWQKVTKMVSWQNLHAAKMKMSCVFSYELDLTRNEKSRLKHEKSLFRYLTSVYISIEYNMNFSLWNLWEHKNCVLEAFFSTQIFYLFRFCMSNKLIPCSEHIFNIFIHHCSAFFIRNEWNSLLIDLETHEF